MEYEICSRCHLNEVCIQRSQDCKRWNFVYNSTRDDLDKLVTDRHKAYDNYLYTKG